MNDPVKYSVSQYGFVKGEEQMMAEIMARGPISCRQAVTKDFFSYKVIWHLHMLTLEAVAMTESITRAAFSKTLVVM